VCSVRTTSVIALSASASASSTATASLASALAVLVGLFLVDEVQDFVGHAEELDCVATHVHCREFPKAIALSCSADHIPQVQVHPGVTVDQLTIVRFPIFQLHQDGPILCRPQE